MIFVIGCGDASNSTQTREESTSEVSSEPNSTDAPVTQEKPPVEKEVPQVDPPTGALVYQPGFLWMNDQESFQGTGFITKGKNGEILGVTSAHFVDFQGPALAAAVWLSVHDDEKEFLFYSNYGKTGNQYVQSAFDYSTDFLVFFAEEKETKHPLLEIDPREKLAANERIWLPNKDFEQEIGYRLIEGTIIDSSPKMITIKMDEEFPLQSQSGSPFISQQTGKVIGILASAHRPGGELHIIAAPVINLYKEIQKDLKPEPLKDTIGGK